MRDPSLKALTDLARRDPDAAWAQVLREARGLVTAARRAQETAVALARLANIPEDVRAEALRAAERASASINAFEDLVSEMLAERDVDDPD